jgi:hypothetical protein
MIAMSLVQKPVEWLSFSHDDRALSEEALHRRGSLVCQEKQAISSLILI